MVLSKTNLCMMSAIWGFLAIHFERWRMGCGNSLKAAWVWTGGMNSTSYSIRQGKVSGFGVSIFFFPQIFYSLVSILWHFFFSFLETLWQVMHMHQERAYPVCIEASMCTSMWGPSLWDGIGVISSSGWILPMYKICAPSDYPNPFINGQQVSPL